MSSYHYINCSNPTQLYLANFLSFSYDDSHDLILDVEHFKTFAQEIYDITFQIYVQDAYSHQTVPFRTTHRLHKAALDGYSIHIFMNCDCDWKYCPFNDKQYYYNSNETIALQTLKDKIPLIKANVYVSMIKKME